MMQGKKILLGVTGSIAAYKSLLLVRLLVKEGAEVKVIITPSAKDFVTPLSLATLSKHPVLSDLFEENTWANHVELGRWADLMLIAPLSCNTLAKMAQGICDNLLMATYLSATCPVVTAPAMDEDMWKHPSTQANLARIQEYGNRVIQVERGELASGLYGDGRMAEPGTILDYIKTVIGQKQDLVGKRALVTAGPTYEAIDPVRFIGNHSSGKMGIAIAWELARRGAQVDLVLGPSSLTADYQGVSVHKVTSAEEMYNTSLGIFPAVNIAVMSAAVADFRPVTPAGEKIKKKEDKLILELTRTKDILLALGQQKKQQVLVGFALETTGERAYALDKLKTKNADLIVLNSLNDAGAGFGYDTNKVTIFDRQGGETAYERKPKQQVAADIVDRIVNIMYA
ncbi:bifunctional phosphopantothenoylcysteine decarboxylase/phosphopantothenate--cysteine ligase CoaBC [Flavitalea sp. BT771]|uniref:bifunctional phosphopantothenoylcysteine decarboxylase/phosphopantothenate--cysteine ligase CoaBC n=1 Tax=Flavitalea sp. BT771 TaxID=3063329 RepID=UPI0026E3D41C|nr:bifunctional phosphopantothenoylcysteine decarboxylase/phosphopantothenate--cysteine ligase CoaBC [Flavitalea sp. BT771]MDO6429683.1 bifunctional phosphopantothenoylcysteine decarboxylase/phosphopantothenate--cysteine ligase CoaBC [Flavitalea sp. BT771]MDV6218189.1 bifunctional phosphopantothenoylcysteine decarboxylase/phosphopantothenate--cysteine ligase CoaBC [Flavitalea sp. BT771]